ncbi:flagellar motor switch protein FliG [Cereibacter sphaeroides]|uniref:flagellar motor switch protein FliG n=1 Tax=Cereibacter sphaeroides TaxID=1063 RepID=UPI001F391896|nr:FliG C-terminal domain-containing protein [Cereibacter sphaeroides]MCE6961313.1 flagellar motor switch protein FliG [Cereibacter sphaeroides]MCE6970299.1 flagellar motor switch protein FliG [Cereibacter sphaeroides]MCE6972073.1 flagellar motor switch protein FliG [Cereibacter sphaeroides]
MSQALARIRPAQRAVAIDRDEGAPRSLSRREKAAIIVRLLLAEGAPLPLTALPDDMQEGLAEQMARMRTIDRATMTAVVEEFVSELEAVGLSFPGGLEGALAVMDGHISPAAATRLRRQAGVQFKGDPWERLVTMPPESLVRVLEEESVEVAAVMLSKLPVAKAADLLSKLPGEKARRVAYAVSQTGSVEPETVRRIGQSLAAQLDAEPPRAFASTPVERVGAILNVSAALTRDEVLKGLEEEDAAFAEQVRKAIFTFEHVPQRLLGRDVSKVTRAVDQSRLVAVIAAAQSRPELVEGVEFLLANMSQRMAQALREEAAARSKVKDKEAEEAMNAIVAAIRQLEAAGEIVLVTQDEED